MKEIIAKLQSMKIKNNLQSRYVDHLRLVGSFARWEEQKHSDIDLLFQFKETSELDRSIYALPEELEQQLGRRVDMFDIDYLNKHIAPYILSDKIAIW